MNILYETSTLNKFELMIVAITESRITSDIEEPGKQYNNYTVSSDIQHTGLT